MERILIEIPHDFFVKKCDFKPPSFTNMQWVWFFSSKRNQIDFCIQTFEAEIKRQGLEILGWREVPVDQAMGNSRSDRTRSSPDFCWKR